MQVIITYLPYMLFIAAWGVTEFLEWTVFSMELTYAFFF